ncbi:hypothetical protein [Providencia alcalifaciens]|uniref:hypothetical protein n=1 Tax=Providencia alcalifaciens TaxID=126385 RepID=UPI001CC39B77|nr:hypothetical protein [Providencia alcalifaciens]CAG9436784.1 hypothetical protein NVI2019_KOLGMIGM_04081 [Providencia alcalifaciens]CAG9436787.1 hypothetical protein NVI2019_PLFLNFOB_04079 [Providencia alcalifaciens]CAG9436809.1 hypothetical protein NVI2019_OGMBKCAO_04090 [Providencia alcalifaciens]CAG9436811.1 hypothetical protein NVI2019_ANGEOOBF_04080 [Providencia alcalifaciens]CAG9437589.1 hypothetical protein NVI2019_OHEONHNH_04079 [Providencia alcalifaciens]
MIMKRMSVLLMLFVSFFTFADVSVIGITINQDTKEDIEKKYVIENKDGAVWELKRSEIPIEGIKKAEVIFQDKHVKGVWLVVNKYRFDYFFDALKSKYKLIKKDIPFVGDQYAQFEKENVLIWIDAPHMGFNMDVVYMDKKYKKELDIYRNKMKQEKKNRELEQL